MINCRSLPNQNPSTLSFSTKSYHWSLFSRWSGNAHLTSIPLKCMGFILQSQLGKTLKVNRFKDFFFFLFTFSPASPASPTGPMKPTKPWNTEIQHWMHGWKDILGWMAWKKNRVIQYRKRQCQGFLTLSPMGPGFPVTPGSPCSDAFVLVAKVLWLMQWFYMF